MTLPQVLEALLFASPKPLTIADLRTVLKSAAEYSQDPLAAQFAHSREEDVRAALAGLAAGYREQARAFELSEGAAGWQFNSVAECAPWVRQLFPENRPARLSPAALETLAIIAYRQPVARAEVEAVRGVDAGGVVQTLLDRGLVRIAGRAEVPGRPLLYATTQLFLEHFGVKEVKELPAFDELRKTLLAKEAAAQGEPAAVPENRSTSPEDPKTGELKPELASETADGEGDSAPGQATLALEEASAGA
jgi:segregation and condensation protein B